MSVRQMNLKVVVRVVRREAAAARVGTIRNGSIALGLLVAIVFLPWRLVGSGAHGSFRPQRSSSSWSPVKKPRFDIRTAEEFGGPLGHIAGSVDIPIAKSSRRLSELLRADNDHERGGSTFQTRVTEVFFCVAASRRGTQRVILSLTFRMFSDRGSFRACTKNKAHGNPKNHTMTSPSSGRLVWPLE